MTETTAPGPASPPSNDPDAEMARLLREAGLGEDAVDPSSLEALRDFVGTTAKRDAASVGTFEDDWGSDEDDGGDDDKMPPFKDALASPSTKVADMLSEARTGSTNLSDVVPPLDVGDDVEKKPAARSTAMAFKRGSTVEEQLEFQTQLLLEMQHQIQVLTEKVDRLEGRKPASASNDSARATTTLPDFGASPAPLPEPVAPRVAAAAVAPRVAAAPRPGNAANDDRPGLIRTIFSPLVAVWDMWWQSRVVRILTFYWEMSTPHVRPVDGALIFKLLFFSLVVMTRLNRRAGDSQLSHYKFIGGCLLMVFGVLYHTKYLQFTYKFVFQDQVPLRVWNGEDENGTLPPRRPDDAGDRNAPANQNRGPDLPPRMPRQNPNGAGRLQFVRNTFLGGLIAPREERMAIINFIQDIMYLFGSFWLSIFPMWRPEGPPPPPAPPAVEEPAPQEPAQPPPQEPEQPPVNNNQPDIPRVAPPRDAMEAADD